MKMRILSTTNIVLVLLGTVLITMETRCFALPVPSSSRIRSEPTGEYIRQQPSDKCPRGVCENKGRICEVICKNNPSEGGKFCK